MHKLLVVTPLAIERDLLSAEFSKRSVRHPLSIGALRGFEFPELDIYLAEAGHGKVQFALQTQFFLHHLREVSAVVCAGAAGALSMRVEPGHVVVAERTIEHDFRLRFSERPLPEFAIDESLLERLRSLDLGERVHFGAIASGDEDVVDSARADEIAQMTKALAVAWEGAGGARASHFCRLPFLEVRGVTDRADKETVEHFKTNLPVAMKAVAAVIVALQSSDRL